MELVALIRGARSLGKVSATPVLYQIVDTGSVDKLAEAVTGFDTVVNATLGDIASISNETGVMVEACRRAQVARFIHLSSAVVYGRVEQPIMREDEPPQTRSWMLYAREKARAEILLKQEMAKGGLQIVVLRPGLVWGPGSKLARMIHEQLGYGLTLPRLGEGICNLIYVDNLVEQILRAACSQEDRSGFYNARDLETVTWKDFAEAMAAELRLPEGCIRLTLEDSLPFSPKRALEWALQMRCVYRMVRELLKRISPEAKQSLKSRVYALTGSGPRPPGNLAGERSGPARILKLDRENWSLQTTVHSLPAVDFLKDFGPHAMVPFAEAMRRTVSWLMYANAGPQSCRI